ncbi:phospholipase D-like domain-containing protein [Nocardioides sp. Kera G14]|uniref:phospholipase D-like domain-containing protein n=1 Tax=Nocardioides sp. Kera G14 TaxID=2884264 RepID=UPI001D1091E7|nr:phospholipase D-like domain-containing protein [Nocardioides sp. Kera G14]UDY25253.1 phospholipase D-like domain-containing protein [Nocardioides sp. Kera G14]
MRFSHRILGLALVVGMLTTPPAHAYLMNDPDSRDHPQRTVELLTSDPIRAPHWISDRLVELIDGTPEGEEIDVVTYFIASSRVADALSYAVRRGVRVHVLLAGNGLARQSGNGLISFLEHHGEEGSWGQRSVGAARGDAGLTHQKTWRFSRSGGRQWVILTGSYNTSERSDRYAYAHMWEISGDAELWSAFSTVFAAQHAQRTPVEPLVEMQGSDWEAYFMPFDNPTLGRDPAMKRLAAIPTGPSTTISIEMYSMWGPRGEWIARRLATMAAAGTRITLLTGPWVDPLIQPAMAAAGVRLQSACFADHTYTHAKDMAATWIDHGRRTWWTWLGSDNWTSQGTTDDEAVLGLEGESLYDEYLTAFEEVRRRQGLPTAECDPIRD